MRPVERANYAASEIARTTQIRVGWRIWDDTGVLGYGCAWTATYVGDPQDRSQSQKNNSVAQRKEMPGLMWVITNLLSGCSLEAYLARCPEI